MLRLLPVALVSLLLACFAGSACAQYKWIDENGQAAFGDQPPKDARKVERLGNMDTADHPDDPLSILPFEIQRAARSFPVVLYARNDCGACAEARSMLQAHSVPYVERSIMTREDIEAFRKLGGKDVLPVVSIGNQLLYGYNASSWTDALAVAGYPQGIPMPHGWQWPSAKPLVPPPPAPAPDANDGTTDTSQGQAPNGADNSGGAANSGDAGSQ